MGFTGGAVGVRLGAGPSGAEWSEAKWKADKSGALLAEQGSCFFTVLRTA